jgi:hypothetical protein
MASVERSIWAGRQLIHAGLSYLVKGMSEMLRADLIFRTRIVVVLLGLEVGIPLLVIGILFSFHSDRGHGPAWPESARLKRSPGLRRGHILESLGIGLEVLLIALEERGLRRDLVRPPAARASVVPIAGDGLLGLG